jgi:hypothetical protein
LERRVVPDGSEEGVSQQERVIEESSVHRRLQAAKAAVPVAQETVDVGEVVSLLAVHHAGFVASFQDREALLAAALQGGSRPSRSDLEMRDRLANHPGVTASF